MGDIVSFRPRKKKPHNRIEAMIKGQLEVYVCDICGEEFEILFNDKPKNCPGCGREIIWENDT